jgi:hypothetical protein
MRWLTALLLLIPLSGWAADGDSWAGYTDTVKGEYAAYGYLICDGKVAADSTCSEVDLTSSDQGWPSYFTIQIITIDPQCASTPDFQVRGTHTSGGTTADLKASMSEAGVSSQDFDVSHRFVDVSLTDDTGCDAPGNDVAIILYYER